MRTRLGLAALALLALRCTSPSDSTLEQGVVRWGTSFGFCAGYCQADMTVDSVKVQLTRSGRDPQQTPPVVQSLTLTAQEWRQVADHLDSNQFAGLKETYGCPDCADGGAEWVELETAGLKKRVTFEYGKEPEELKEAVAALRAIRARFPS